MPRPPKPNPNGSPVSYPAIVPISVALKPLVYWDGDTLIGSLPAVVECTDPRMTADFVRLNRLAVPASDDLPPYPG